MKHLALVTALLLAGCTTGTDRAPGPDADTTAPHDTTTATQDGPAATAPAPDSLSEAEARAVPVRLDRYSFMLA